MEITLERDTGNEEQARVVRWRFEELARAGYEAEDARVIAAEVHIDLHVACDLVRRGCPPQTAVRILA